MKNFIPRLLNNNMTQALKRGKSVLLLGPRQTGKTTLIQEQIKPDSNSNFEFIASNSGI